MYWILFVMGAIAAVVIALLVGGLATPAAHTVARTIVLPGTPDTIWSTLREPVTYQLGITHEAAPHQLVATLLDDDLPFSGSWTWTLADDAQGTRLTVTEQGRIGNPIVRFFAAHVLGHTRSIDAYLRDLALRHRVLHPTISDGTPA